MEKRRPLEPPTRQHLGVQTILAFPPRNCSREKKNMSLSFFGISQLFEKTSRGFLKWEYPISSSILLDFPYQPSSYWVPLMETPIWNLHEKSGFFAADRSEGTALVLSLRMSVDSSTSELPIGEIHEVYHGIPQKMCHENRGKWSSTTKSVFFLQFRIVWFRLSRFGQPFVQLTTDLMWISQGPEVMA